MVQFGRITEVEIQKVALLKTVPEVEREIGRTLGIIPTLERHIVGQNYKIPEEADKVDPEEDELYTTWATFRSADISLRQSVDDEGNTIIRGEFPYNIDEWEDKYEINFNVSTKDASSEDEDPQLELDCEIYNVPSTWKKTVGAQKEKDWKKLGFSSSEGDRNNIIVKSGYMGPKGPDLKTIFAGPISSISYHEEPSDSVLEIEAEGGRVKERDVDVTILADTRIDKAIERLCRNASVPIGEIQGTKYADGSYVRTHEKLELTGTLSDGLEKLIGHINKHLEESLKYNFRGMRVNVVIDDYNYRTGYRLTFGKDLQEISPAQSSEEDDDDEDLYEAECVFLPSIATGSIIELRRPGHEEVDHFMVEMFEHDVDSKGDAVTSLEIKMVESSVYFAEDEIRDVNRPRFG